jgi:hypothetical protein
MSDSGYRKLTGKKRTLMGFSQLWLGSGYLLLLDSTYYTERYRRFALSDIQAILVTESRNHWVVWDAIAIFLSLAWSLLAITMDSPYGKAFFIGSALLVIAIVLINMSRRGALCRCVLQTAVSCEPLPAVSRMRTARKFLAAITPAIEAIQGRLSPEQLPEQAPLLPPVGAPLVGAPPVTALSEPAKPPEIGSSRGYTLEVLFGVLLLDSLLVWLALRSSVEVSYTLLPMMYVAELTLGIISLVQARASRTFPPLVAIALVCVVADLFLAGGAASWRAFAQALQQQVAGVPKLVMVTAPARTVWLSSGWRVAIGAFGLIACLQSRRQEQA